MKDEKSLNNTVINWFPGHMAKTRREIKENINLVDIVYEVIDSRMPLSSKIIDIDELIGNKDKVLIMTKYDLCDKTETDKFIEYYKNLGYKVLPVDLMGMKDITKKVLDISNDTYASMNESRKSKGLKPRSLRAMVVGVPNVGKSTLINRLVNKKAVNVGNKPGVTKTISWIRINKDLELLDTPGILWPKLDNQKNAHNLAVLSSIKEEILDPEQLTSYIIEVLYKLYPDRLISRYGVEDIDLSNLFEYYNQVGKARGALLKGNLVDYDKVFSIIINDLKNNKFGNITFDRIEEVE
jgi:ribosome biogenesis GTPase A